MPVVLAILIDILLMWLFQLRCLFMIIPRKLKSVVGSSSILFIFSINRGTTYDASFHSPGGSTTLYTRPRFAYGSFWLHVVDRHSVVYRVKACSDAHVIIAEQTVSITYFRICYSIETQSNDTLVIITIAP